jgi:hypothetical protein
MHYQKDINEKRKKDGLLEIYFNAPFILFGLIAQLNVFGQEMRKIGMAAILWMASINSAILVGFVIKHIIKFIFADFKTNYW